MHSHSFAQGAGRLGGLLLMLLAALLVARALPAQTHTMQTFVIVFRQGPHPLTPADREERQRRVSAWATQHTAAKLEPRILGVDAATPSGKLAGDNSWPVTALLFLEAPTLAAASEIAASHPACDYNAHLEVRPWSAPARR